MLKIKIWKKSLKIIYNYLGKEVFVYNGFRFVKLKILEEMIGFRFGEFLKTKITKHNVSKQKQKGKIDIKKKKK